MTDRPLVFIGLPGSGKSAVAEQLGLALGRPVISIDQLVVDRVGMSIADLFVAEGEQEFRRLETELLNEVMNNHPNSIVDGGGGLVVGRENRRIIREQAVAVWLDAPNQTLLDRMASFGSRPLLTDNPSDSIAELRRSRLVHYTTVADAIVQTAGKTVDEVVSLVTERLQQLDGDQSETGFCRKGFRTEQVELADGRTYPVVIGRGATAKLSDLLPESAKRVAVITQAGIGVTVASGRDQKVFTVEDGEQAKRLDVVGKLCSEMASWGMTRSDVVVSVGGGVVSDLAGFVAASYHRGIPVVHVSTTLLGQIDAAIGGKCGVNLPEGKNLVGAFWQPAAVICDTETLETLPAREFVSGMGELAKYHFLGGGDLAAANLDERVARSVRIKADVVGGDEREGGRRAILNYGHTLAHALETAGGYELRHGEAVGIGLVYAAEVARRLGRVDQAAVELHRAVVQGYGLDPTVPTGFDHEKLVDLFGRDKKAITGITFVLDGPSGVEPVLVEDRQLLLDAFEAVSA